MIRTLKYTSGLLLLGCVVAGGDVQLASVFSDHMVLQRGKPVPVWGTAEPGEKVAVEFAGQKKKTVVGAGGKWKIVLDPMAVSAKSLQLVVSGKNQVELSDILVGDVWLCSGQSNMEFTLKRMLKAGSALQTADLPNLRLLEVPGKTMVRTPADGFESAWKVSSPESAATFSAVGYLFGSRIHVESGVPIGLIECAKGSSSVECWVSGETLESDLFAPAVKKWREVEADWGDPAVRAKHIHKSVKKPESAQPWQARTYPASCYNTMLHPLFPFAMKGVVWYQGEANRERGFQYRSLFPAMVSEWRERFGQDNLRFYIVQLPEMGKKADPVGQDSLYAELREAQALTARNDPLMEMAVIIDTDSKGNLHPKNKQLPGDRLARIALAKDYGKEIKYSGPVFRDMETNGNRVHLFFDHAEGLMTGRRKTPASLQVVPSEEAPANFAVAGADREFFPATAEISGDRIVVFSGEVKKPVAVRYAWANNPAGCNLYNRDGLPAAPFRTDSWPCISRGRTEGQVVVVLP